MAAKNRNTFEKLQREMEKKRKAASKRERRRAKKDAPSDEVTTPAHTLPEVKVEDAAE